jgi:transposase
VCPARGLGAALVLPTANADMMTRHLAELSATVQPGHHAGVVLDGAGWHKTGGRLTVPDNISLLVLPPYAPELNPVENVWQYLRQNFLAHRVFEGYEQIVDACRDAWNRFANNPEIVKSITSRQWGKVNV